MAKSIDSLLKKKGWSGEEVGKALIASTIHDVKHQSEPDFKPLFSQSDFEKMESSLSSDRDYIVYGVYRDLYSSIIDAYNRGQGLFQQFYNGYSRYSNVMFMCQNAEEALKRADSVPLIMTQSQYNRHRERARATLQGFRTSFSSLLFHTLQSFIDAPEEAPEDIRELIEATKKETATNPRILGAYNEDYGNGYYTLPDGRRSDKMTSEEWQQALEELYLKTHSLIINGRPATPEETHKYYNEQRTLKAYKLFFDGIEGIKALYKEITGEEMDGVDAEEEKRLLDTLEDMLGLKIEARTQRERKEQGKAPLYPLQDLLSGLVDGTTDSSTVWSYYPDPPQLTKYDVLAECLEHYSGAYEDDIDEKDQLKEFKADYPALFSALDAFIKEAVPTLKPLKPAQYFKEVISWGELAELSFMGYESYIDPSNEDIITDYCGDFGADPDTAEESLKRYKSRVRGRWSGVAVMQNPASWQTDENGDYKETPDPLSVFFNLDSLADSESQRAELDAFQNNLFKPALRFIYAYNALMKIIGAVYDIDDTDALQLSTRHFESQLEGFNNLLYMFYGEVYGDPEEKQRKRELVKELFQPTDPEELKPTKEAIDAVTAELTELGYTTKARKKLKNFDRYIALLMGEGA